MTFCAFKNKGEQQHGEISFLTNAPDGSLDRLESLGEGYSSEEILDPRFAVLLSQCLLSNHRSDFLFEDIFEDFEDGPLCALCLRSERNSEALPVLPSSEEYSMLSDNSRGKLPKPLQFVAPPRFGTSSLVQALSYIDNLLPGTELEIHTTTSAETVALRPMIKNVRVLTLPYLSLSFKFCNVYTGTQGKTLPLIHRHPDAVVLLWCKGVHDHVFFVTMAQLLPCLQDMKGPDVGLDFMDQPAPSPHVPPQPPATPGDDMDYPGYDDPHVDMPVDDEDMPPQNSAPEPDLNDDPIGLSSGGNPPPHPPGSGVQVPYLVVTEMKTWIRRTIRMKMVDIPQKPVRRDRDLAMGRLRTSQLFLWSTMKSRLLLEVLLMLLGLRRNMLIRTRSSSAFSGSTEFETAIAKECVTDPCSWPAPRRYVQGEVADRCGTAGCVVAWSVGWEEGSQPGDFPGSDEPASSSSAPAPVPGCLSQRENSLFSKHHSRNPPRNLLCRKTVRIRIRTQLLIIAGIPCLPWLLVTTMF